MSSIITSLFNKLGSPTKEQNQPSSPSITNDNHDGVDIVDADPIITTTPITSPTSINTKTITTSVHDDFSKKAYSIFSFQSDNIYNPLIDKDAGPDALDSHPCNHHGRTCVLRHYNKKDLILALPSSNHNFCVPASTRYSIDQIDCHLIECGLKGCTNKFHFCCYCNMLDIDSSFEHKFFHNIYIDGNVNLLSACFNSEEVRNADSELLQNVIVPYCGRRCFNKFATAAKQRRKRAARASDVMKRNRAEKRKQPEKRRQEGAPQGWNYDYKTDHNGNIIGKSSLQAMVDWFCIEENATKYFGGTVGNNKILGKTKQYYYLQVQVCVLKFCFDNVMSYI